jgi:hypothetical protein
MHRRALFLACVLTACALARPTLARPRPSLPSSIPAASALCRDAILHAESAGHIPERLMDAIAVVESGRRDPVSGAVYPWPWTINAEGIGHWYETKAEVIAAVKALQARGVNSIDVGCMQVNLMHHPDAFPNLETAFDPAANATYGAHFLRVLYNQTYAWPLAAAAYHSFTPDIGADYARKVLAAWGVPQAPSGAAMMETPAPPSPVQSYNSSVAASGRVAVMLPNGTQSIRVMAMAPHTAMPIGAVGTGRGLDAYRSMPIRLAMRMPSPG